MSSILLTPFKNCTQYDKIFCSIALKWDYKNRTVDLSIPGYIKAVLTNYKHASLCRPEHVPHAYEVPRYTRRPQMVPLPDETPVLPKDEKRTSNRC
eukprot:5233071-Ditylum_brightwellii.AAC.1